MRPGDFEHYDAHISFRRQAELSSPISPVYLFIGVLAEYLFEFTCFPPQDKKDGSGKKVTYWGSPHIKVNWTNMRDPAEFTLEVLDDEGRMFLFQKWRSKCPRIGGHVQEGHWRQYGIGSWGLRR